MMAPAPTRSSYAGRSDPSPHCSPAGTSATRSKPSRYLLTAAALRRQPATTGTPLLMAANAIDEPFGDGSTSRVSASTPSRLSGDSVSPSCDDRLPASTAPMSRASCRALSPPTCGQTTAPRSTAIVRAVENDRTSTTTTTSLRSASVRAPTGPHSSATGMRPSVALTAAAPPDSGSDQTTQLRSASRRAPASAPRGRSAPRSQRPQVRVERAAPARGRWPPPPSGRAAGPRGRAACPAGAPAGPAPCGRPGPRPRRSAPSRPPAAPAGRPAPVGRRPAPRRAAQREVLLDAAGQVAQPAVAEQRAPSVADPLEEVAVVADHEQRARPAVEQVLQRGQRVDVQVVGRLVEQQHVRLVHQQPQQLQPPPLAAGQVADRRPLRGCRRSRTARTAGSAVIVRPLPRSTLAARPSRTASSTRSVARRARPTSCDR